VTAPDPPPPLPPPPEQAPPPPEAPGAVLDPAGRRRRSVGRWLAATAWVGILGQPLLIAIQAAQLVELGATAAVTSEVWTGRAMTGASVLGFLVALYALWAAHRLRHRGSAREARLACLFLLVPCSSPCCLLGVPVGLWGLWALRDDD
jgi:hypothetical protein